MGESFRPQPGVVTTVHERGEVVSVRGRLTPLLRVGQHLGTPGQAADPTDGTIVVVESADAARGVLVDELLGRQEVFLKEGLRTPVPPQKPNAKIQTI